MVDLKKKLIVKNCLMVDLKKKKVDCEELLTCLVKLNKQATT